MSGPWTKYGPAQPTAPQTSQGPWSRYQPQNQEREKIVGAYAQDIMRRQQIYGGLPADRLQDPATLYALAEREAEREGWKMPQVQKQDRLASGVLGYTQGGTLGFGDEISGGVDAAIAATPKLLKGDFTGASEAGGKAYQQRVEADRRLFRQGQLDNPVSYVAGELVGAVSTGPPLATAGRSTAVVAASKAKKAADLTKKAQAASGARQASLQTKAARLSQDAARLARPAQNMGEVAGRIGRIAGEGAMRGAAVGGVYGGIYGLGTAEGTLEERLPRAAMGAGFGAVGGAVLTPLIQGLGTVGSGIVYKLRTPQEVKALDMVLRRAERSGTNLQDVKALFDRWEKTGEVPETLAEMMGPSERSLLSALITVNRETREQATEVFVGRGRNEVNRLEEAFAKSFGAGRDDFQKTKAAAAEARSKEAQPFYDAAYIDAQTGQRKFLGQPETDQLAYEIGGSEVAQDTLPTAWKYADALGKRAIRDEIKDFSAALAAGKPVKPLSVEAADYIERGVNRRLQSANKGDALDIPGGIASLRNRIRAIIDPSGLGDARATAAEAIRRGELLEEGLDIMSPAVDVDDVERVMRGIPDAGIDPASDAGRTAYGVGASRAVANKLRNTPDMAGFADAARQVARTPALREKLEAARPKVLTKSGAENKGSKQTKANAALDEAIERASNRSQFGVDMVGNSRTAFRQGDVEDAVLDDAIGQQIGESIGDLLIAGAGGVSQRLQDRLGRAAGNRIGQPSIYNPRINREAANILLATGDQIPVQIKRLAARAAQRASGQMRLRPVPPPQNNSPSPKPKRARKPPGSSQLPPPAGPIRAGGFAGFGGKKPPQSAPLSNDQLFAEYDRLAPRMAQASKTLLGTHFETTPGAREALVEVIGKAAATGRRASDDQIIEETWSLMRRRMRNGPNWPPPKESLQAVGPDEYMPDLARMVSNKTFFEVDLETAIRESLTDLDDILAQQGMRRGDDMIPMEQLKGLMEDPRLRALDPGGARPNGLPAVLNDSAAGAFAGGVVPMPSSGDWKEDARNRLLLMAGGAAGAPILGRAVRGGASKVSTAGFGGGGRKGGRGAPDAAPGSHADLEAVRAIRGGKGGDAIRALPQAARTVQAAAKAPPSTGSGFNPDRAIVQAVSRAIAKTRARIASVDDPRQYGPRMARLGQPERLDPNRPLFEQVTDQRSAAEAVAQGAPARGREYVTAERAKRIEARTERQRAGEEAARRNDVIAQKQAATRRLNDAERSLKAFYGENGTHTRFKTLKAKRAEEARLLRNVEDAKAEKARTQGLTVPARRVGDLPGENEPPVSEQYMLQELARERLGGRTVGKRQQQIERRTAEMLIDPEMSTAGAFAARAGAGGFTPPEWMARGVGYTGIAGTGGGLALGVNALAEQDKAVRRSGRQYEDDRVRRSIPQDRTPAESQWGRMSRDERTSFQATLNWLNSENLAGDPDGNMGPQTTAAIMEAQEILGLPVTGVPDVATRKAIAEQTELRMMEYREKLDRRQSLPSR